MVVWCELHVARNVLCTAISRAVLYKHTSFSKILRTSPKIHVCTLLGSIKFKSSCTVCKLKIPKQLSCKIFYWLYWKTGETKPNLICEQISQITTYSHTSKHHRVRNVWYSVELVQISSIVQLLILYSILCRSVLSNSFCESLATYSVYKCLSGAMFK